MEDKIGVSTTGKGPFTRSELKNKINVSKIDLKAQLKNEEESLRIEKMRERVRKGLQKYDSLPKEYTNSVGMEFVLIPPGEYFREEGDPPVFITEPYYMGKYPVTQRDYLKVMKIDISVTDTYYILESSPMEFKNKDEIFQFIYQLQEHEKKEYNIPKAIEWEYAANGGLQRFYTNKIGSAELGEYAWTEENSGGSTHPLGEKKPNAWDLYDMIGNVWEFCQDWIDSERKYLKQYYGGSWKSNSNNNFLLPQSLQPLEPLGVRLVLKDLEITQLEHDLIQTNKINSTEKIQSIQEGEGEFKKLIEKYVNSFGMEFLLIPPGEFRMDVINPTFKNPKQINKGYDLEKKQKKEKDRIHIKVIINKPFYFGKYPITQGEWGEVMEENPSIFTDDINSPIERVYTEHCQKFINNLNKVENKKYRLPSEVERKFANLALPKVRKNKNSKNNFNSDGVHLLLMGHDHTLEEVRLNKEKFETRKVEREKKRLEIKRNWVSLPKEYVNTLGMKFVLLMPGEFLMGAVPLSSASNCEEPQHKVRITKPFYIGKYPVTQEEWESLMGNNPSEHKKAGKRAPVDNVSWDDCQEYIRALNLKEGRTYRLPTEAEWEYAARGGGSTLVDEPTTPPISVYTYGDAPSVLGDYAWYDHNSNRTTHPVGEKKPNSIGLYDMMGNVLEWCWDYYDYENDYYKESPVNDPTGTTEGSERVLRGGSWFHNSNYCRLSSRYEFFPDLWSYSHGFRLILVP